MLQTRTLGTQGLVVSELGLGTMGMTAFYGAGSNRDELIAVIRQAHELGVTLFDTAELYNLGKGLNEDLVGEALEAIRGEVQIATKFGFTYDAEGNANGQDSSPANIRRVAENSLRYLRTDVIDIFYQHRPDPAAPVEDVAAPSGNSSRRARSSTSGSVSQGQRPSGRHRGISRVRTPDRVLPVRTRGRGRSPSHSSRTRDRIRGLLTTRSRLL